VPVEITVELLMKRVGLNNVGLSYKNFVFNGESLKFEIAFQHNLNLFFFFLQKFFL